jgi:hypothetical protein
MNLYICVCVYARVCVCVFMSVCVFRVSDGMLDHPTVWCDVCEPAQVQCHLAHTVVAKQSYRRCGRCGDRRGVAVRAGSSRIRSRAEGAAQLVGVLRTLLRTAFSSDVCGYFRIA